MLCYVMRWFASAIKNGVLARCDVFFLVGARSLVCRVVGLVLFVLISIFLLYDVVVMIVF